MSECPPFPSFPTGHKDSHLRPPLAVHVETPHNNGTQFRKFLVTNSFVKGPTNFFFFELIPVAGDGLPISDIMHRTCNTSRIVFILLFLLLL